MASMEGSVFGESTSSTKSSKLAAVLRKLHGATVSETNACDVKPLSPGVDGITTSEVNSITSPIDSTSELNSPASDNSVSEHCISTASDLPDVKDELVYGDKLSERTGSSRRKQQKTRKVVDMPAEDTVAPAPLKSEDNDSMPPLELAVPTQVVSAAPSKPSKILIPEEHGVSNDSFVLPEGTVLVQPESVDSSPAFQEIETSRTKGKFKGNLDTAIIHCTACHRQIGADANASVCRHPVLKVLICKKCYKLYCSASIEQDVDGSDEQCRWCGQGGDLICCDYCHNAICKTCIRRNLGRKELSNILNSDGERWRCYVCDPKPLLGLIEHCTGVMEALARQEKTELDRRRKPEIAGKPPPVSQPLAQPVSVIQTAESAIAALARSKSHVQEIFVKQQQFAKSQKMIPGATASSDATSKQQIKGMKTVAALLQEPPASRPSTTSSGGVASIKSGVLGQQVRPPSSIQVSLTGNPVSVIDRLLQATNSMNVFLQSLRLDAKRTAAVNDVFGTANFEKRREIGGKLARAYAAYARSFQDAISSCQDSNSGQVNQQRAVRPPLSSGGARPGTVQPRNMPVRPPHANQPARTTQPVRPLQANVRPPQANVRPSIQNAPPSGRSILNRQVLQKKAIGSEVIELSDSDDDRGASSTKTLLPTTRSTPSTNAYVEQVLQLNRAAAILGSTKIVKPTAVVTDRKGVQPVAVSASAKRSHSPDSPSVANTDQASKRARLEDKSSNHKMASNHSEDGVMFDGDVDEIPDDDLEESQDNQNLQMYCDADEDANNLQMSCEDASDDQLPSPSDVVTSVSQKLPNGKLVTLTKSQKTVSDFNRNVPSGGKHISAS